MKYLKIFLFFSILTLFLYGSGRLYYRLTDGFRMSNVAIELRDDWAMRPLTSDEKALVGKALSQPYHYLDKGHQAYVFASADDQFVLKLLKFQRGRVPNWLRSTSLPFSLEQWRLKRIAKKDQMLNSLLTSWKLSFEALKEEASIVYVHINKTHDLPQKLQLRDKLGLAHELDLNNAIFQIQRKAPLLGPTLDQLMAAGQIQEAKELLNRLIALFVSEYKRGLAEKELFILRNTGVWLGQPMHIDTGRFEWDATLKEPENYRRELKRKTAKLQSWLQQHHAEVAEYFAERVEKQL